MITAIKLEQQYLRILFYLAFAVFKKVTINNLSVFRALVIPLKQSTMLLDVNKFTFQKIGDQTMLRQKIDIS